MVCGIGDKNDGGAAKRIIAQGLPRRATRRRLSRSGLERIPPFLHRKSLKQPTPLFRIVQAADFQQ